MKLVDVIVLLAAVGFVSFMIYRKVKQHFENKKQGIVGCGGGCSGCSQANACGSQIKKKNNGN